MYDNGHWNDENCNSHLPYICATPADGNSGGGGGQGGGRPTPGAVPQYRYFAGPLNALAASDDCVVRGGQLASVHSAQELQQLNTAAPAAATFWIGLNDATAEATGSGDDFVWSDGSATSTGFAFPWQAGEPNSQGDEDCVQVYANNNQRHWNDLSCGSSLGYVCDINADSTAAGVYGDCIALFHNDILQLMENVCYTPTDDITEAPSSCTEDCANIFLPYYTHCGQVLDPPCLLTSPNPSMPAQASVVFECSVPSGRGLCNPLQPQHADPLHRGSITAPRHGLFWFFASQVFPTISAQFGATMGDFNRKCIAADHRSSSGDCFANTGAKFICEDNTRFKASGANGQADWPTCENNGGLKMCPRSHPHMCAQKTMMQMGPQPEVRRDRHTHNTCCPLLAPTS